MSWKEYTWTDHVEVLREFITRMEEVGFHVAGFWEPFGGESLMHKDDIAYQALNYEHTNIRFENSELGYGQTISVMLSGDKWCDVVPINDWTLKRDKTDFVDLFVKALREEHMGEDA